MRLEESLCRTRGKKFGQYAFSLSTILVVGVLSVGAILRFLNLADQSYWIDELISIRLLQGGWSVLVDEALYGRPPVYLFIAYFWSELFGTSEAATRSLTALSSVASLFVFFLIGRRLFSRRVAFLATLVMALSAYQLHHAQNIRYYSFVVLFALFSYLFLIRLLASGRLIDMILYVFSSALLYYTHPHGIFIIVAQGAFVLLTLLQHRSKLVIWFISQVLIGLLLLPMFLVQVPKESGAGPGWLWLPGPYDFFRTIYWFIFGYEARNTFWTTVIGLIVIGGSVLFSILRGLNRQQPFIAQFRNFFQDRLGNNTQPFVLTFCWFIVPLGVTFILSYVFSPLFFDRYIIAASPALYLLIGFVLSWQRNNIHLAVLIATVVVMISHGIFNYYAHPQKEEWRQALAMVSEQVQPGDRVVLTEDDGNLRFALQYYATTALDVCALQYDDDQQNTQVVSTSYAVLGSLDACSMSYNRLWIIDRPGLSDASFVISEIYESPGANEYMQRYQFYGLHVYLVDNSIGTQISVGRR